MEQSGCRKPERGATHEVLLSHRLGYSGFRASYVVHMYSVCAGMDIDINSRSVQ